MRKLATIEKIKNVRPIPNADAIEVVEVRGWEVVTKKGDFKKGDLCVYFEIDSVLPEKEEFEFLRKSSWDERHQGFRLRTVKLRGQVSQGLVSKLSILPSFVTCPFCKGKGCTDCYNDGIMGVNEGDFLEGMDVTELLGVVKYEPKIPESLNALNTFPYFVPKTDEERVQNIEQQLIDHTGQKIYITEKVDGTSSTFFFHEDHFGVCSRRWELKEDNNCYWRIAKKYDLENKLRSYGESIAIQGEILGPGIQGNKYKLSEIDLYLFNAYDIINSKYYPLEELKEIAKLLEIKTVPILNENDILTNRIDYWIEKSDGISVLNNTKREGIVVRTHDMKFSFKSISRKFLLKHEE
jgi:RNA ligase (TIGR02306 family)